MLLGCKLITNFGKKYFFKVLLLDMMIKTPISVYFDVYGCQMNVNDTEIAWSILQEKNYHRTTDISEVHIYEQRHEKTNIFHMRKQRCRSALR